MRHRLTYQEILQKESDKRRREQERIHDAYQKALVEPLWYLRSIPYQEYRQTHYWKKRSQAFRESAFDLCCVLCGISEICDNSGNKLEWLPQWNVHHLSYERLGEEDDSDLCLLCVSCHNLVHYPDSHAGKYWAAFKNISAEEIEPFVPKQADFTPPEPAEEPY